MKARTKLEKRVVELQRQLPALSKEHWTWAWENAHKKYACISRGKLYCFECNHKFEIDSTSKRNITCPKCKSKLSKVFDSTKHEESVYSAIYTTSEEFQVVRILWTKKFFKRTDKPCKIQKEVVQYWIDQSGNVTMLGVDFNGLNMYGSPDAWIWHSNLSIKKPNHYGYSYHRIYPSAHYPKRKFQKILRRNGFKGYFNGFYPQDLFEILLKSNKAETLFKAKQYDLVSSCCKDADKVEQYWSSIKIAIRNNYIVKNTSDWFDYLDLLTYFGKDLHSPKYVCPDDLLKEHNKYVLKKRKIDNAIKLQEQIEKIEKDNIEYQELRSPYFDILISDNEIEIKTLQSVREFFDETEYLNHCVFTNEYYKKTNSLCLSARINNVPIETIEIDLRDFTISQARGMNNKPTIYHDRIIKLMRDNMNQVINIQQELSKAS